MCVPQWPSWGFNWSWCLGLHRSAIAIFFLVCTNQELEAILPTASPASAASPEVADAGTQMPFFHWKPAMICNPLSLCCLTHRLCWNIKMQCGKTRYFLKKLVRSLGFLFFLLDFLGDAQPPLIRVTVPNQLKTEPLNFCLFNSGVPNGIHLVLPAPLFSLTAIQRPSGSCRDLQNGTRNQCRPFKMAGGHFPQPI